MKYLALACSCARSFIFSMVPVSCPR
uniref:Uncharacterized protein n=1 Tax=Anguilla anguilla TaxID=7936 RepID=A0A0E9SE02_ANGAN